MRARWLRRLSTLAAMFAVLVGSPGHSDPAARPGHLLIAGPVCPNGTNWDSVLQTCR